MLKLQGATGVVAGSLCLVWVALHSKHEMLIILQSQRTQPCDRESQNSTSFLVHDTKGSGPGSSPYLPGFYSCFDLLVNSRRSYLSCGMLFLEPQ